MTAAEATVRGFFVNAGLVLAIVCACGWAAPAAAQTTPSFTARRPTIRSPALCPSVSPQEYSISGGLLDFAVLEQNPNTSSYQVEIFHGNSDGTFSRCSNVNPNPVPPRPRCNRQCHHGRTISRCGSSRYRRCDQHRDRYSAEQWLRNFCARPRTRSPPSTVSHHSRSGSSTELAITALPRLVRL